MHDLGSWSIKNTKNGTFTKLCFERNMILASTTITQTSLFNFQQQQIVTNIVFMDQLLDYI